MKNARFWATYETIRPGEAIVELTLNGEWQGGGLVTIRSTDPAALYEAAYRHAAMAAASKGGTLDRFTEVRPDPQPEPTQPRARLAALRESCGAHVSLDVERRPANALNVEIGTPAPRCIDKRPEHWPANMGSLRWLASGGSPLVFGPCSAWCPRAEGRA